MYLTRNVRRWRAATAAGGLLVLGACRDAPTTAPRSLQPTRSLAESSAERGEAMFVPNTQKYSDRGHRPTSARTGSATLAMLALLSGDGTAEVEVVAGEWSGWTRGGKMRDDPDGDATLSSVQIKAFDPDGKHQYTRNFGNVGTDTVTVAANGLVRGGSVQVQGNVKGADFARTGVVTVEGPVRLRPDLAVSALRQPPRAVLHSAVPIVAVVRELNGDFGAWADCVLVVDGAESDRVHGLWVDAGGTVTCAFSHLFRRLGESRLEVRVEQVSPRDYDVANNAVTSTMTVIRVPSSFYYQASFEDRSFKNLGRFESSWSYGGGREGGESVSTDSSAGRSQQSYMLASMPHAVSFPLTEVFARQATRDEVAHSVLFRQLPADWTYEDPYIRSSCVSRGSDQPTGRGWLYVCTNKGIAPETEGADWTTVQYDRYAGDVTYASRGHSRYWNRDLGIDDVYAWNYSSRDVVGRFVSYGLEYGFFARIVDGPRVYTVNPLIGLLPFESIERAPRTCWSWEDAWGSSRSCSEWTSEAKGVHGWVHGEPAP